MTHWQHPRFFAYFPANAAPVSVVAEYLVSAMAAQCMLWQTSPAATELETKVIDWLRQALGLPDGFSGVIQDSASSGDAVGRSGHARARAADWAGNRAGLSADSRACASIPQTRFTPRSIVPSGFQASARKTLSACAHRRPDWRSMDTRRAGGCDRGEIAPRAFSRRA